MWGRLRAMLEPLPAEPVIYEPDWQANSTRPPGRCRTGGYDWYAPLPKWEGIVYVPPNRPN